MKSVLKDNPEIYFVPPKRSREWGKWDFKSGSYYDTTIGSKHAYWKNEDLPKATKDIKRLRSDMLKWGYMLLFAELVFGWGGVYGYIRMFPRIWGQG